MGLLRSLARKVVARVVAPEGAPVRPADLPHEPTGALRGPTAPPPEPPAPSATPSPLVAHDTWSVKVAGGAEAPVVEDAAALAHLDAGAQEVWERVGAGEPVVLVDVRAAEERVVGVIPGARMLPLTELEARWRELEACDEVVCVCADGVNSRTAAEFLRARGLFNATALEGGIAAWRAVGGPVRPSS